MKKNLIIWQVGGLTFSTVFGTMLHFLYDLTGSSLVIPFSAINESTWEHMKILFFPMLIYTIIQSFWFVKEYPSYWCVKLIGIMAGILTMPTLFYTIMGIFGKTPDWINILIFIISAGVGYYLEYSLFEAKKSTCKRKWVAIVGICAFMALFVIFTYFPPQIPLFIDPRLF